MKSFAAALLAITAYGSQIEASTAIQTGATTEIESIALGLHHGIHGGHHDSYSDS